MAKVNFTERLRDQACTTLPAHPCYPLSRVHAPQSLSSFVPLSG
jgi:hypothetical protein